MYRNTSKYMISWQVGMWSLLWDLKSADRCLSLMASLTCCRWKRCHNTWCVTLMQQQLARQSVCWGNCAWPIIVKYGSTVFIYGDENTDTTRWSSLPWQAICNESFRRCTMDNVTVVTVFLDWDAADWRKMCVLRLTETVTDERLYKLPMMNPDSSTD